MIFFLGWLLGYAFFSGLFAILDNQDDSGPIVFFWPVTIPFLIVFVGGAFLGEQLKKVNFK